LRAMRTDLFVVANHRHVVLGHLQFIDTQERKGNDRRRGSEKRVRSTCTSNSTKSAPERAAAMNDSSVFSEKAIAALPTVTKTGHSNCISDRERERESSGDVYISWNGLD
jgi:hypothetical protein